MLKEFINFVREKAVIGLAVGIIIGGSVTQFVNAIIKDLINPIISALLGNKALVNYNYTIPGTKITFLYGDLLLETINFIAVLFVIYILFIKSPLNKLDKKK